VKRNLLFTGILVFLLFASFGCKPGKEDEEVRNFVKTYVSVMQGTYAKANLNIIAPYATEKEIRKMFPIIQALKATDNIMNTEVLDYNFKKSSVNGDTATVTTSERWRYWWQDKKTGVITKPKAEESYRLEYNLVKVNGRWKVDFIKNLDE
jgi:hypothetical protein